MVATYQKYRILLCVFGVVLCSKCTVAYAQVVINEVMFNPKGSEFFDEYIELYNAGDVSVDLTGWRVGDGEDTDEIVSHAQGLILGAGQYALILDANYFGQSTAYDPLPPDALVLTVSGPTIGNGGLHNSSNERVVLIDATGDTVSAMMYQVPNESGISEEKIDPQGGDAAENWADAKWVGGTPGRVNSVSVKSVDLALRSKEGDVEKVPWMQNVTVRVWAVNVGRENISQFQIQAKGFWGAVTNVSHLLAAGDSVEVTVYQGIVPNGRQEVVLEGVLAGDQDLSNQTARWRIVGGYAPGQVVINEVMAAPSVGNEWVELLNLGHDPVSLVGWVLKDNRTAAEIKSGEVPGLGFIIVPDDGAMISSSSRFPALNNGGDELELLDATGSVIDRVTYPAATPNVSLERIDALVSGQDLANWLDSTVGSTPGLPNSVKAVHVDTVSLVVDPNPFDTETRIRYQLPVSRAHVNLWIFDRAGRKVRALLDASEAGAQREIVWDGRNDGQQFLKPGIFVLYLEARSPDGQVFRAKTAVAFVRGISN